MKIKSNSKYIPLVVLCFSIILYISCEDELEEEQITKTELLTNHIWLSDSLLAGGVNASGPGEILEKFAGETKFNLDGTGTIGQYIGNWKFNEAETQLIITSDSLPAAVTTFISELTESSLKVATVFPLNNDPKNLIGIKMTFIPKE